MAKLVPMSNYKLDVKLTGGENYQEWNARIMTQFIATDMNKIHVAWEVLKHFQVGMESCDPHVLWIVLRNEFRRGNVIETTSIFIDIYSRKVRKDEGVREYIDDLLDTRRVLCENGGRMGDCELARIMVCNVHMVYPSVTNYFTKDKERRVLEIKEAISLCENAEHMAECSSHGRRGSGQVENVLLVAILDAYALVCLRFFFVSFVEGWAILIQV
ncbi:hypothetical protein PC118_g4819 [Phytophthora cactorum]|uniref:Uncharacterized protein n=2 Tax=Phytophthora cactorum TaxID=29920 RepID=A0A8T1GIF9_9STRA|nr:hypothetical protein PC118_g4819 [Phytophthora cactorum]